MGGISADTERSFGIYTRERLTIVGRKSEISNM